MSPLVRDVRWHFQHEPTTHNYYLRHLTSAETNLACDFKFWRKGVYQASHSQQGVHLRPPESKSIAHKSMSIS
jgi:hypothetical protein